MPAEGEFSLFVVGFRQGQVAVAGEGLMWKFAEGKEQFDSNR
jgi:hypothetical protein